MPGGMPGSGPIFGCIGGIMKPPEWFIIWACAWAWSISYGGRGDGLPGELCCERPVLAMLTRIDRSPTGRPFMARAEYAWLQA